MFRPPVSYFVFASFFTISTLRLTGLAARGLRYRYGEKNSAISFGCGLMFMLVSYNSGSSRLELTEAFSFGQYSSPSIRPYFRLLVKKTTLVGKCQTPIIARNFFHANAKSCSASESNAELQTSQTRFR